MKRACLVLLTLLVGVVGCAEEEGLTVRGDVSVTLEDATTGFLFPQVRRLAIDAAAIEPGVLAGRCLFDDGTGSLVVSVSKTGELEGNAMRAFTVEFPVDSMPLVTVELASGDFIGTDCSPQLLYRDDVNGSVGVDVAPCTVISSELTEAIVVADLHFGGCL